MTGIIKEDMPTLGLKKGDTVRVVSTQKKMGRKTIKWTADDGQKTAIVDAWRVQETLAGWK